MSLAILCIVLCLVRSTVMEGVPWANPPRTPRRMPWPGQQCLNSELGYVGVCAGAQNICRNLVCAYPDGHGGFIPGRSVTEDNVSTEILQICHDKLVLGPSEIAD